jgi:hypothetical protein
MLAFIRPHIKHVRRHLDVGSSLGKLMGAFRSAYGCASYGVEPAEIYRWKARDQGLNVVGSLADLDAERSHGFDLVSLSHVLEHMTDPVGTLRRIHCDWMARESYLLVEVPNLFGHPSLEFAHLSAFTRDTLLHVLEGSGFAPVAVAAHGQPHSRRLPFYLLALAKRVKGTSTRKRPWPGLGWIRLRRWAGMLRLKIVWAGSSLLLGRAGLTPWKQ